MGARHGDRRGAPGRGTGPAGRDPGHSPANHRRGWPLDAVRARSVALSHPLPDAGGARPRGRKGDPGGGGGAVPLAVARADSDPDPDAYADPFSFSEPVPVRRPDRGPEPVPVPVPEPVSVRS